MVEKQLETLVIRKWSGRWKVGSGAPSDMFPPGGYVVTRHRGTDLAHRVEHHQSIEDAMRLHPEASWLQPDPLDEPDVVLVGIL